RSSAAPSTASSRASASKASGRTTSPRARLSRYWSRIASKASSGPLTGGSPHFSSSALTVMAVLQQRLEFGRLQFAQGPETDDPYRPGLAAEPFADFGVGQPLEPEQLHHLTPPLGELGQGCGQLGGEPAAPHFPIRRVGFGNLLDGGAGRPNPLPV